MQRGGCRCRLRRGGSLRYAQISQGHLLITLAFNYLSLILYMTLSESFTPRVCVSICKMLVNYLMPTNCFEIPKWNALSLQLPSLEAWCVLVSARISAKSSGKERSLVLNTPQGTGEPQSCSQGQHLFSCLTTNTSYNRVIRVEILPLVQVKKRKVGGEVLRCLFFLWWDRLVLSYVELIV